MSNTFYQNIKNNLISCNFFMLKNDLIESSLQLDEVKNTDLMVYAIASGNIDIVKHLLRLGFNYNIQDEDGNSPLMIAIKRQEVEMVSILLALKADTALKSAAGFTAMHYAAIDGTAEILKPLLDSGAPMSDPCFRMGRLPIHYAAEWGCHEAVAILCKYGADPNVKDSYGMTPLFLSTHEDFPTT